MHIDIDDVLCIFFGLIIVSFLWFLVFVGYQDISFSNKFKTGEISLETYCKKYETSNNPPVSCYEYFNVKKIGDKLNCNFNPTIKTTICNNTPILESK